MEPVHIMDTQTAVAYSVAVVDDDPRVRTILAMHLGDMARAASFPNLSVLENKTAPGVPMVVVLGPSYAEPAALTAAVNITRIRTELVVVLVAEELSTTILQQAMRSGVSDVIVLSTAHEQLAEAV